MEKRDSHWTEFEDVWYFSCLRKSVEKVQVLLKSSKNNGCFTRRRFHIYDNMSLNSCWDEKCFTKPYTEHENTNFMFNNFFPKIAPFMRWSPKIWWRLRGHKWHQNMVLTRCMLDKQGYMHVWACTRARAPAFTCGHTHTHTHTHT
jgi:hypothetical protein